MLFNFLQPLFEHAKQNNVDVRGVLHVGAHDGEELIRYDEYSIPRVVFCEANPEIFHRLEQRCSDRSDVLCFNYAISDGLGEIDFYVTNNDSASSSILKLKDHLQFYPHIQEEKTITVTSITIDKLFEENSLSFSDYNILNIDIQGAELIAFRGMEKYLEKCDYVYTEVNFSELYERCGILEDIDRHLNMYGFSRRFCLDTGFGWGDAFYVKERQ